MSTATAPIYTHSCVRIPADRADNPVVQLLVRFGSIDQRNSSQTNRDEALAALIASGAVEAARQLGYLTVYTGNRGTVYRLVPAVGMTCTEVLWTDSHGYEIVAISKSGSRITLRPLKATRDPGWKRDFTPGGFVGHTRNDSELKYCYESAPEAPTKTASRCKDGSYRTGRGGRRILMGVATEYYDSNF